MLRVTLVASTKFHDDFSYYSYYSLLERMGVTDDDLDFNSAVKNEDELPELAGRLCYLSFPKNKRRPGGNKGYLKHIKEIGHGSVLEHTNFTFLVEGISRSCSHELVRHRAGCAYSQLSQRYVENEGEVVVPELLAELSLETQAKWAAHMAASQDLYEELIRVAEVNGLELKPSRGMARSVLPEATGTKIMVTMNARALRHFFKMRGHVTADIEIRRLAIEMWRLVSGYELFSDITINANGDELAMEYPNV